MVQDEKLRSEFAQRLRKSLSDANYPAHGRGMKLARELGVSSKAVSKWLAGESLPRPAMMNALAKTLRIDPLWLQHGDAAKQEGERLINTIFRGSFPLIGWSEAEHFREVDQQDFKKVKRFASGSITGDAAAFWLRVKDDSMTSLVGLCVPQESMILVETNRPPESGDLVIAKLPSAKEATFKQLFIDKGTNRQFLKPLNSSYLPIEIDEYCIFLGVVIESRMNFVTPDPADVTFSNQV